MREVKRWEEEEVEWKTGTKESERTEKEENEWPPGSTKVFQGEVYPLSNL